MHATYPAHLITLITHDEEYYEAIQHATFSALLLLSLSWFQHFSQFPVLKRHINNIVLHILLLYQAES
jgi:hypothetical protein